VRLRLGRVFTIICIGQFFNAFLLGATGGDVMRVLYILREAPGAKIQAGLSVLVDRFLGLSVLALLALAAAGTEWSWLMGHGDLRRVAWALVAIPVLAVAGVAAIAVLPLPEICARLGVPENLAAALASAHLAVKQYLRAPGVTALAAGLTVVVQLCNLGAGYCTARALGLTLPFASMAVILSMVFFVIAVPVSASGHGVRESAFILMFSLFGVDAATALGYSVCYLGLTLAWSIACAPAYLVFRGKPAQAAELAPEPLL
jgi:uncharacterized membrane protein YbhN (UPF0104 family)